MKNVLILAFAAVGAMATTLPSMMGVEVIRENGAVIVREVTLTPRVQAKPISARSCTNCVHVGGQCTIGEGNCMSSESASCTDCSAEGKGVICVDTSGGSCNAP